MQRLRQRCRVPLKEDPALIPWLEDLRKFEPILEEEPNEREEHYESIRQPGVRVDRP